jgi:hypothetical protein
VRTVLTATAAAFLLGSVALAQGTPPAQAPAVDPAAPPPAVPQQAAPTPPSAPEQQAAPAAPQPGSPGTEQQQATPSPAPQLPPEGAAATAQQQPAPAPTPIPPGTSPEQALKSDPAVQQSQQGQPTPQGDRSPVALPSATASVSLSQALDEVYRSPVDIQGNPLGAPTQMMSSVGRDIAAPARPATCDSGAACPPK